jgi:hypothetical protein
VKLETMGMKVECFGLEGTAGFDGVENSCLKAGCSLSYLQPKERRGLFAYPRFPPAALNAQHHDDFNAVRSIDF